MGCVRQLLHSIRVNVADAGYNSATRNNETKMAEKRLSETQRKSRPIPDHNFFVCYLPAAFVDKFCFSLCELEWTILLKENFLP